MTQKKKSWLHEEKKIFNARLTKDEKFWTNFGVIHLQLSHHHILSGFRKLVMI